MSRRFHPLAGTIRLEPRPLEAVGCGRCDDSSLDMLFAGFAHHAVLSDNPLPHDRPFRLVTARRLTWLPAYGGEVTVRANLSQLIDDLEAEFEELGGVAS